MTSAIVLASTEPGYSLYHRYIDDKIWGEWQHKNVSLIVNSFAFTYIYILLLAIIFKFVQNKWFYVYNVQSSVYTSLLNLSQGYSCYTDITNLSLASVLWKISILLVVEIPIREFVLKYIFLYSSERKIYFFLLYCVFFYNDSLQYTPHYV